MDSGRLHAPSHPNPARGRGSRDSGGRGAVGWGRSSWKSPSMSPPDDRPLWTADGPWAQSRPCPMRRTRDGGSAPPEAPSQPGAEPAARQAPGERAPPRPVSRAWGRRSRRGRRHRDLRASRGRCTGAARRRALGADRPRPRRWGPEPRAASRRPPPARGGGATAEGPRGGDRAGRRGARAGDAGPGREAWGPLNGGCGLRGQVGLPDLMCNAGGTCRGSGERNGGGGFGEREAFLLPCFWAKVKGWGCCCY